MRQRVCLANPSQFFSGAIARQRLICAVFLASLISHPLVAAPLTGIAVTDFYGNHDSAQSITVLNDATIVTAGVATNPNSPTSSDIALAAYTTSGAPFLGFGKKGRASYDLGSVDALRDIRRTHDGKLIAVGKSEPSAIIARFNPDGSLDQTFGLGGVVKTTFGAGFSEYRAVIPLADGRAIAFGSISHGVGDTFDIIAARYRVDGALDPTFGVGGKIVYDVCSVTDTHCRALDDWITTAALAPDGQYLLGGYSGTFDGFGDSDHMDALVMKLQINGKPAVLFGAGGATLVDVWHRDYGEGVIVQPDGRILLAGESTFGLDTSFLLIRLLPNGVLDPSFGVNGKIHNPILPGLETWATSLVQQPDGKLVIAGYTKGGVYGWMLWRYFNDGTTDNTFGNAGHVLVPLGGATTTGEANDLLYLPSTQQLVATGSVYGWPLAAPGTSGGDFATIAFQLNGKIDPSFGAP